MLYRFFFTYSKKVTTVTAVSHFALCTTSCENALVPKRHRGKGATPSLQKRQIMGRPKRFKCYVDTNRSKNIAMTITRYGKYWLSRGSFFACFRKNVRVRDMHRSNVVADLLCVRLHFYQLLGGTCARQRRFRTVRRQRQQHHCGAAECHRTIRSSGEKSAELLDLQLLTISVPHILRVPLQFQEIAQVPSGHVFRSVKVCSVSSPQRFNHVFIMKLL